MDWTDFFTGIAGAGSSIARAVVGPTAPVAIQGQPGSYYLPQTGAIANTGNVGLLGAGSNSLVLILLVVVVIFALRK